MQGGSVEATSAGLDMGSEFVVRLPLLPRAPERAGIRTATGASPRADAETLRILIVDDDVDSAEGLMMLLRRDGHDVRVSHDGRSAVKDAVAFRPQLILLDIGMPGMDGHETARELRRIPGLEEATLVALTGYGQEDDRRVSREAGIDRHCVKPIDRESLGELVASVARRHGTSDAQA